MITADEDKVLNLISNNIHTEMFTNTVKKVKQKSNKFKDENINTNHISLAIKILVAAKKYEIIKAIFTPDIRLKNAMKNMPESMLIGRIQICVVNNNCISNCKIIME